MSKRNKGRFEPRPDDFFATPLKAVLPLIPYLRASGIKSFAEPRAGVAIETIRHAVLRDARGEPLLLIGAVDDELAEEQP